jgi:hypothetical protein
MPVVETTGLPKLLLLMKKNIPFYLYLAQVIILVFIKINFVNQYPPNTKILLSQPARYSLLLMTPDLQ